MGWKISASVVAVAVVAGIYWMLPARQEIPAHLKRHPLVDVGRGFLDDATIEALLEMTRSIRTIGTAARDYDMYTAAVDHIGEAVPVNTDGSCPALFLMPNGDKTRCVFPGRSDVGRHYIKSGGTEGRKESFDLLASRVQPFQKLMFDWSQYGVANKLMADEKFTNSRATFARRTSSCSIHFSSTLSRRYRDRPSPRTSTPQSSCTGRGRRPRSGCSRRWSFPASSRRTT
jgi:hypothetical protein